MRSITEEDVVKSYLPHLIQVCRNSYKGMELEDRLMEGKIALLHSIRTYKTQYGGFEEYMLQQLTVIMEQKNKEAWAMRRLESLFSLDAGPGIDDVTFALSRYVGTPPLDDTIFDVKCFIEGLPSIERQTLIHLMEGYSISTLSSILKLSVYEIHSVIERLQNKAVAYFCIAFS
ncbi:hypothetical protein D3C74_288290 [compost metagenome]